MAVRAGHKEELTDLDKRVDELRRRFDMYFHGAPEQRMPPSASQAKLGGELRRMREDDTTKWNTQDRFHFNQIFARFISLDRMWARTMKQIEDGTHRRDKFKVAQMKKRDAAAETISHSQFQAQPDALDGPDIDIDIDIDSFDDQAMVSLSSQVSQSAEQAIAVAPRPALAAPVPPAGARPAIAPVASARPAAPRERASSDGAAQPAVARAPAQMSDQRLQQLYEVYMKAKQRTGEQSTLTVEALRRQIEKQIPAIQAKHKCHHVDFKIVLKDGRAMLKAIPKQAPATK